MSEKLLPCPFCGHDTPEFERMGDRRQSCIVICGNCGARHESSDEGNRCGSSWNQRGDPGQDGLRTSLETALARIEDMLADDDGQAFKEARKFLDANRPLSATPSAPTAVEPDEPKAGDVIFGVNERGDGQWIAWTAVISDNSQKGLAVTTLSVHSTKQQAHEAANAARASKGTPL